METTITIITEAIETITQTVSVSELQELILINKRLEFIVSAISVCLLAVTAYGLYRFFKKFF